MSCDWDDTWMLPAEEIRNEMRKAGVPEAVITDEVVDEVRAVAGFPGYDDEREQRSQDRGA